MLPSGLSLSAAAPLPARVARADGGAGNWDTCLVSPRGGGAEPEGSAETKVFYRHTARGDMGGRRGWGTAGCDAKVGWVCLDVVCVCRQPSSSQVKYQGGS